MTVLPDVLPAKQHSSTGTGTVADMVARAVTRSHSRRRKHLKTQTSAACTSVPCTGRVTCNVSRQSACLPLSLSLCLSKCAYPADAALDYERLCVRHVFPFSRTFLRLPASTRLLLPPLSLSLSLRMMCLSGKRQRHSCSN